MELFLLALLAAAASSAEEEEEPGADEDFIEEYIPDLDQLQTERFYFFMRGELVQHWTPAQETAWMLGAVTCPEGHSDTHITYIDDLTWQLAPMMRRAGRDLIDRGSADRDVALVKVTPKRYGPRTPAEEPAPRFQEIMPAHLFCSHPQHRGPRVCTLPKRIDKAFQDAADEYEQAEWEQRQR